MFAERYSSKLLIHLSNTWGRSTFRFKRLSPWWAVFKYTITFFFIFVKSTEKLFLKFYNFLLPTISTTIYCYFKERNSNHFTITTHKDWSHLFPIYGQKKKYTNIFSCVRALECSIELVHLNLITTEGTSVFENIIIKIY